MATNNSLNFNSSTPASPSLGGSGVSNPTANGILVANGAAPFSALTMTNGQVLIGGAGAPTAATLTAGSGISITNGSGSITIASSQPVLGGVVDVTGSSQAAAAYTVYLANNATLVTFTLPASPLAGEWVEIIGVQGLFDVDCSGTQTIRLGNIVSSAAGSLSSSDASDSVKLVATTAGTGAKWRVVYSVGNLFDLV